MKKKLYLKAGTAVAALIASTVSAQANVGTGGIKSGFYAGASVGLSNLSGNQKLEATRSDGAVLDIRNNGLSATSAGVAVFAGYGQKYNCTWIAAELSYLFDRLNGNQNATFDTTAVAKTFQSRSTGGAFGASLHLGYIPHENYVAYVILGVEMRRFQFGLSNPSNPVSDSITGINAKKYTSVAFTPGLGMLVKLSKNVSLRGEYKYALHRSKTVTATSTPAAAGGLSTTSTLRQSPRVQSFQIGVVYSF
ncbi:MAG: hypothetical protein K0R52_938 [Alphaproteobacteria bacterium]|jgi:opacity protein-like surface antigen|nr:hypothetical protein [Alphaproteobacteria bacterium]